jgi:putative restriction endonuclease
LNLATQTWLGKLANLNVARTADRGAAPHKPLMLLTVMDLFESGDIPDGWVKFDVRLVSRFRDYWELVLERQRNSPDIPMPFHALGGARDRVWQTFTASGEPSEAKATTRLCHLDPDLFTCLQDADFRHKARETLVSIYFIPAWRTAFGRYRRSPCNLLAAVRACAACCRYCHFHQRNVQPCG